MKEEVMMEQSAPHPNPLPKGAREPISSPLAPLGRGAGGEGRTQEEENKQFKTRHKSDFAPLLQTYAKEMRHAPTDAEGRMWFFLRNRRMAGNKFRRQHALGHYILDFICIESRLVVELDGGQHATQPKYDSERTLFLEQRGLQVLRFWNDDVLQRSEAVLEVIWRVLEESGCIAPHPQPLSPKGRGETDTLLLAPSPLRGEGWGEGSTQRKNNETNKP
ncbi:MAG: endonuclease domain-containing protein [Sulfuricella sp.]|nr:endonuclease domain-containing protein [Sulfuricella sp.]